MNQSRNLFRLFMFGIFICYSSVRASDKTLLCYLDNEITKSDEAGIRFIVKNIDRNVCTYFVHCNIRLDLVKNEIIKDSEDFPNGHGCHKVKELKNININQKLKVLVILRLEQTSWNKTLVQFMDNTTSVATFANKIAEFLLQHDFDGVNFEFYPYEHEQPGFRNLVIAMKEAFKSHKYLLVYADKMHQERLNEGIQFSRVMEQHIDFIVIDTFNFHDSDTEPWQAAHHSPLYNQSWDEPNKSVDSVVNHWIIKEGFPPNKILLGISLFGRSWKLSSNVSTPPAPADGPGLPRNYTKQRGFLSYFEICQEIKNQGWKVIQDPSKTMGPYAFSSGESNQVKYWMSYDDPAMVKIKSEYIISKKLGGAAVKYTSYDDLHNKCGGGQNPMLTAIRKTLTPSWVPVSSPKRNATSSTTSSILYLFLLELSIILAKYFQVV